jgi:hypothetical protein
MFVWAVILRPKLSKMVVNSFLALSASLPDVVLRAAKPSSRYRPTSFPKRFSSVLNEKSDEFTDLSAIETSHGHVKRGGVVLLRPSLLVVKKKGFARVLHNEDIAVGNCDELLAPCDCTVE